MGSPTATSADFADDIRAALAWLRTRADIDPARLGLVGHSEGGMIAPMIAVTDPALRAMVLVAARHVRTPTLVLQGETDTQVTPEQAGTLAAAIRAGGNRHVTVRTFPRMNHLMLDDPSGDSGGYGKLPSYAVRRDFLGVLADWLASTL